MKTFVVTVVAMRIDQPDGHTLQATGASRTVEADYYRIMDGDLIFRTVAKGNEQYNPAVRTFARGFWSEVYEHKPLAQRVIEHREAQDPYRREIDLPSAPIDLPDFLGAR